MSTIRVDYSGVSDLARDLTRIPPGMPKQLQSVVRDGAKAGNTLARDFARRSAGTHGKLYPRTFSTNVARPGSFFGVGRYSAEYGPDASRPQGNMSFEWGSRNQRPHLDLNKSADIIGGSLAQEVRALLGDQFWAGSS